MNSFQMAWNIKIPFYRKEIDNVKPYRYESCELWLAFWASHKCYEQ